MKYKTMIVNWIAVCALATNVTAGSVISDIEEMRAAAMPQVSEFVDGFLFEVPSTQNLVIMNIRVYDQAGKLVLNARSKGEPVEFFIDGLPDGEYRYEAVLVNENALKHSAPDDARVPAELTSRHFGHFSIRDGERDDDSGSEELSTYQGTDAAPMISRIFDTLIQTVHAADITASSSIPTLNFDDTDTPANPDFYIRTIQTVTDSDFEIRDQEGGDFRFFFYQGAANANGVDSIRINTLGDVFLGNSAIAIDRSAGRLGIGTQAPNFDLSVHSGTPSMYLLDETDGDAAMIQYDNDALNLFVTDPAGPTLLGVLGMFEGSPAGSIVTSEGLVSFADNLVNIDQSSGWLGIGTQFPSAPIHLVNDEPAISMTDSTDNDEVFLNYDDNAFNLFMPNSISGGTASVFSIFEGAPLGAFRMTHNTSAFANNSLVIDHFGDRIGVGETNPDRNIHVRDALPALRLESTLVGATADLTMNNIGDFQLVTDNARTPLIINRNAPSASLFINQLGDLSANEAAFEDRVRIDSDFGNVELQLESQAGSDNGRFTIRTSDGSDTDPSGGLFVIQDNNPGGGGFIFAIEQQAAGADTTNALRVSQTGQVRMFGNDMVVDNDSGSVGIGTFGPEEELHLRSADPAIRWTNTDTGSNSIGLEFTNNFLRIKGRDGQDLGKMHTRAPVGTFTTDASGRTGYGTATPDASFNVKYRGAHGAVPVFLAQAANNDEIFRINLNGNATLAGTLTQNSDVNAKTAIVPVDTQAILDQIMQLPISQWQYKDAKGVNHIGPMAQDFRATFGLGESDTQISTLDTSGVALAAIKALVVDNAEKDRRIQVLEAELSQLREDRARLATLESVVKELAAVQAESIYTTSR